MSDLIFQTLIENFAIFPTKKPELQLLDTISNTLCVLSFELIRKIASRVLELFLSFLQERQSNPFYSSWFPFKPSNDTKWRLCR